MHIANARIGDQTLDISYSSKIPTHKTGKMFKFPSNRKKIPLGTNFLKSQNILEHYEQIHVMIFICLFAGNVELPYGMLKSIYLFYQTYDILKLGKLLFKSISENAEHP